MTPRPSGFDPFDLAKVWPIRREALVSHYPRTQHLTEYVVQVFFDGITHKPETTFEGVKADVLRSFIVSISPHPQAIARKG